MNRWRYDDCRVVFYHDGIETDMYKVVDALNEADTRIEELEGLLSNYKNVSANNLLIEENRERLLVWKKEGRSYYWMAKELGIPDRSRGAVSLWFRKQRNYKRKGSNA